MILEMLWRDIRYAVRSLRGTAGFTITAVLTLAFGIGAVTAIFSVFDAVLLRPLPYPDADRLYVIHETGLGTGGDLIPANALHFREWRASTRSFEEMALVGGEPFTLHGAGEPARLGGARVTPSLFSMLGVQPALGRTFREDEDVPGRDAVVVLAHELWTTRFGSDPGVIGRTITLDESPYEVVGVLPAGFSIPRLNHFYSLEVEADQPQIWKPFAATERDLRPLNSFSYVALAKLRPGVTPRQALEDVTAVQAELSRRAPEPVRFGAALVPAADQIVSRSRTALQLVLGTVVMVLLIAGVNITNLLLARGARREREFAIRRAAGADRRRLLWQVMVESLVLSAVAGIAGLFVGSGLVQVIQLNAPVDVPRIDEAAIDGRVLMFTFAVTFCSGILIGLAPAWRATRISATDLLRTSSLTAASGTASGRFRSLLVGVEVAASAVCLIAGALLLSSFAKLMTIERGFDATRVLTVDFTLLPPRYDTAAGARFLATLADRARALPGVQAAGVTDAVPLSGTSTSAVMVEGTNLPRPQRPVAMIRLADAGYFETMGIRAIAGRLLRRDDAGVAVISIRAAEQLWPGRNPLGRRFRHGPDDSPWVEVVGVVNDVRGVSLIEQPPLMVYRPTADYFYGLGALTVKTTADPRAVAPAILRLLRELDPILAVSAPRTMDEIVDASVAERRFQMTLMLLLAAAAAFLAGLGIYAVVAQTVIQRTAELGLRMALGADSRQILGLVLRRAMMPVGLGLAAGIGAALGAGRILRTLLFGVSPTDVMPVATASVFLLSVALLASFVPARRATRLNPLDTLRVG